MKLYFVNCIWVFSVFGRINTYSISSKNVEHARKSGFLTEELPWTGAIPSAPFGTYLDDVDVNMFKDISICPRGATGQFPYPPDCQRFLNCWNGRGVIQTCAPGTLFNSDTGECDFFDKVKCLDRSQQRSEGLQYIGYRNGRTAKRRRPRFVRREDYGSPTLPRRGSLTCPPGAAGVFPHPTDCSKFLNCGSGMTFIQSCGPGTVFNPTFSGCDWPYNVRCFHEEVKPPVQPLHIFEKYVSAPSNPKTPPVPVDRDPHCQEDGQKIADEDEGETYSYWPFYRMASVQK